MEWSATRCIVLRVSPCGEADKLVTLYSPDLGRATAIAKGAYRSRRRFVNKLEPFSALHMEYGQPRSGSLLFLNKAELDNAHLSLRQDYLRYLSGTALCELLLRFTREQDPDPLLFYLLEWGLGRIDGGDNGFKVQVFFLLKLLDASGYRPELHHCAGCGVELAPAMEHRLQPGSGAVLCRRCGSSQDAFAPALSGRTLGFLGHGQTLELDRLHRLQIPDSCVRESLVFLYRYALRLLQGEITCWPLLQQSAALSEPASPGASRICSRPVRPSTRPF